MKPQSFPDDKNRLTPGLDGVIDYALSMLPTEGALSIDPAKLDRHRAYFEGYQAYYSGIVYTENPYITSISLSKYDAWAKGWTEAHKEDNNRANIARMVGSE